MTGRAVVRRAREADVPALVELRAVMFAAMGAAEVDTQSWRDAATRWFGDHLDDDHQYLAVVDVRGSVMACAVGSLRDRIPGPASLSSSQVLISNVATDPAHRRRGFARMAVAEVMRWAREESGAGSAELLATGEGADLYREFGFVEHRFPVMRAHWS